MPIHIKGSGGGSLYEGIGITENYEGDLITFNKDNRTIKIAVDSTRDKYGLSAIVGISNFSVCISATFGKNDDDAGFSMSFTRSSATKADYIYTEWHEASTPQEAPAEYVYSEIGALSYSYSSSTGILTINCPNTISGSYPYYYKKASITWLMA